LEKGLIDLQSDFLQQFFFWVFLKQLEKEKFGETYISSVNLNNFRLNFGCYKILKKKPGLCVGCVGGWMDGLMDVS
jgi:hypothetical protein